MVVFIRGKLAISEIMNIRIFFIAERLFTPRSKLDEVHKGSV